MLFCDFSYPCKAHYFYPLKIFLPQLTLLVHILPLKWSKKWPKTQNLLQNKQFCYIIIMLHEFHNQQMIRSTLYFYIGVFCPIIVSPSLYLVKKQIPLGEFRSVSLFVEICVATIGVCIFRALSYWGCTFLFVRRNV